MHLPDTDSWDEFDWERAFRQDDERIRLYMRELPKYIDLPEEDELILARISSDPAYTKCDKLLSEKLSSYFMDHSNAGNSGENPSQEEEDPEAWQKREAAPPYMLFSDLARLWAQEFARHPEGEIPHTPFLRAACIYGQLILRSSDLLDLPEKEKRCTALKIAIAKRILSGINALCGELQEMGTSYSTLSATCNDHFEKLLAMREKMTDYLAKIRQERASSGGKHV